MWLRPSYNQITTFCKNHKLLSQRWKTHALLFHLLFSLCVITNIIESLKCIWHEISYFLKWNNSLSCSVTCFSVSCFYGLFPRYFNLYYEWVWICPLIYDVMLVASSAKWLNITAIIQDDNFKLHSLVNVMKHWRKTWNDINSF
jgi:hypothetical protein